MKSKHLALVAILSGFLGTGMVLADEFDNETSTIESKEDIIRALMPDAPANQEGRTRGIRMGGPDRFKAPATAKSKNFRIDFASGSYRLSERAVQKLTPVGEALASPQMAGMRFVIEGHTDSAGRASDNERLSMRRAEAVKEYLTSEYGIPPERIEAVGKGERELLDTSNPRSPRNRRVTVIAKP